MQKEEHICAGLVARCAGRTYSVGGAYYRIVRCGRVICFSYTDNIERCGRVCPFSQIALCEECLNSKRIVEYRDENNRRVIEELNQILNILNPS